MTRQKEMGNTNLPDCLEASSKNLAFDATLQVEKKKKGNR